MLYFLDTEFNGFGGELISLALVREDGRTLYLIYEQRAVHSLDPWVKDNVIPILYNVPEGVTPLRVDNKTGARAIANFLRADEDQPVIVADWPDDVKYFCQALITGPGEMVNVDQVGFVIYRMKAYPNDLGGVQHNAVWDALAIREYYKNNA